MLGNPTVKHGLKFVTPKLVYPVTGYPVQQSGYPGKSTNNIDIHSVFQYNVTLLLGEGQCSDGSLL